MTTENDSSNSKDVLMELLSPDGYYSYLNVPKPADHNSIDSDLVKKAYRKLSLKHHPDKSGGDIETFRLLNRAQKVLLEPKLRSQYDVLGIDLHDEETHHEHDTVEHKENSLIQEMAGTVLTSVIQLGVRTIMMGCVSCLIVRYRWTLYPALCFVAYIIFQIAYKSSSVPRGSLLDTVPPTLIGTGCLLMSTSSPNWEWNMQYWLGEALVICMFMYNSLPEESPKNLLVTGGVSILAILSALWLRGKVWNYVITVVLIALLALVIAIAFPMMELLLEAILNEKLKKVGDRLRHQHQITVQYYESKIRVSGQN